MSLYPNLKTKDEKKELISKKNEISKRKFDHDEESVKIQDKIIIGKYSDAPDYLKGNEYIKNGYFINDHSLKLVLHSLFVCSNETINIWSHFLGCIISILLIIFTTIYLKTSLIRELTQIEYESLRNKVNETILPWSSELHQHKLNEIGTTDLNVCSIIDNILSNSDNLVNNFGTKFTTIYIIENFIESTKQLINKIINIFSSESNILDDITTKWDLCVNKIISYITYDIADINKIKGENMGRWASINYAICCYCLLWLLDIISLVFYLQQKSLFIFIQIGLCRDYFSYTRLVLSSLCLFLLL